MNEAALLKELKRLRLLARFMDAGWSIPFTRIRFGLDSVVGLIPVGGDVAMALASLYLVSRAHALGAPRHVIVKMLGNVAIDLGLGAVPVVGDILDVFFRANLKNIDLLEDFLRQKGFKSS